MTEPVEECRVPDCPVCEYEAQRAQIRAMSKYPRKEPGQ